MSWFIIGYFKKSDHEDCFYNDDDERTVYKISLYLCTFSLSVAICATFLLPLSIVSNEVLLHYPKSYYVKWLNHSLIQGIWNLVFLFSNIAIFALLPFAYLFTESEGLSGSQRGVKSRVYETMTVLSLIAIIIFGISYVASALINNHTLKYKTLHTFGSYCLPFLYSCISFFGVMMLLLCTPFGLFKLFGLVSASMAKPKFIYDIYEDLRTAKLEEMTLKRRLSQVKRANSYIVPTPMLSPFKSTSDRVLTLLNGALKLGLKENLKQVKMKKQLLLKHEATSHLMKNFLYPLALGAIVFLAIVCVLLAFLNLIGLLVGLKAISSSAEFTVGLQSLSLVGWFGSLCEVIEVSFIALTSYVGLYTLPGICKLSPKQGSLSLTLIIANTSLLLVLSSALPLLSRIIGITNFDLLGDFGRIEWLGNMKIVLLYNATFVTVTTLCVFKKLTTPVCKELIERIKNLTLGAKYL